MKPGEPVRPLAIVTPNNDRELRRVLTELVRHNPKLRVIILADEDLRYELLQQVLIDCADVQGQGLQLPHGQGRRGVTTVLSPDPRPD